MRCPVPLHAPQNLAMSISLTEVILGNVKWYHVVVLICISLMTNDVEHLFMCFLAICISSLVKCLFHILWLFLNWGIFLFLNFDGSLYILGASLVLSVWLANTCSQPVSGWSIIFLRVFYEEQQFLILKKFNLLILSLKVMFLVFHLENLYLANSQLQRPHLGFNQEVL